jgi:ectoine hydroxylase-related dioxygenase (phytanoyl-CoA dioxygenase family)
MTELTYLGPDTTPDTIAATLADEGAMVLEGVLTAADLARISDEIMPFVEATDPGRDDFTGRQTTRTGALVSRSQAVRDLVMHDRVKGAAEAFLKPYCEKIQLHLTQLIRIMPGQVAQPLHRDRLAWGGFLPPDLEPQFNCIWALNRFTVENGATQVVPGSNKWDGPRRAEPYEVRRAEMDAGSVLLYSGSVIHGGGANDSDHDRWGLNIDYTLGWLRQEENQYLSCPPHVAKHFDPEFQALLGYTMGSYALGYFSPPTGPGENPEVVPPEFLFNGKVSGWGDDLYDSVTTRAKEGGR